ncbi:DUF695 domain-containing protein [Sphingobacterium endophyticum]|uniref:DUF695 domain-containing protein n=1 Tax=Sphingobacterium endophyticum TaxID=2546448 RepID=UPI0012E0CB24|nr:DUF695 domain-containing protein [Sphingobacterium endophyticum]
MFKLFRKKADLPFHEENWQVYTSSINNQIASIIVDLNVADLAPISNLTEVFYLIIPFDFPSAEGLPTMESYKHINEVEDKIADLKFRYAPQLLHVATISMSSERLQMFYCHKIGDAKDFLIQIDKTFLEELTFQVDHREDKKWDDYFTLAYPTAFQMEMIKNRSNLRALVDAGDRLSKERLIYHNLNFEKEEDLNEFLDYARQEQFSLTSKVLSQEKWRICISRLDFLSYESIDSLCLPIWEKAQVYNGNYDGWETDLILR